jgi:2-polyprenyl-3-methyl-5-hydroxy-6-metoxy-1,4-benzoquinol methylase
MTVTSEHDVWAATYDVVDNPLVATVALEGDARVRFVEGDVSAAPREAFDVVMFCLVLEHFERLEAPLVAAAAGLRPGGELRVFELHPAWWHDGGRAHSAAPSCST